MKKIFPLNQEKKRGGVYQMRIDTYLGAEIYISISLSTIFLSPKLTDVDEIRRKR